MKPEEEDRPGKMRTWWHPLLAGFLRWQLGEHYEVREEVPVGKKPLQIDILLLHKTQGELPEAARRMLAGLVQFLNEYTLLELKSPSDTLRAGDFQTLLAYALLYRAQNNPLLDPSRLTLIVIAPRLTAPYRRELNLLGVTSRQEQPGIWRLEGGLLGHSAWLLETSELADPQHPVLTLFSPEFLRDRVHIYQTLRQAGYTELVGYMFQQIEQFKSQGEEFAMQHFGSEDEMWQVMRDIVAGLTLEEQLDMFKTLPPEARLKTLLPEERLKGLSPEERLKGLTPEELERLKDLLLKQTKAEGDTNPC
jgi:hypothetical protein